MSHNPLDFDPQRSATDSIKGYVYQAYQSIFEWINLKEKEVLVLERAEDFEIYSEINVTSTQAKDTIGSGSITLNSKDAIDAINNFWHHRLNNPERNINFRFLTTANIGQERKNPIDKGVKGIDYWEQAKKKVVPIEPLKKFLLSNKISKELKEFLESADDEAIFNELILPFHWDTGSRPIEGIKKAIKDRLVFLGQPLGLHPFQSEKILPDLLENIFEILSGKSELELTYSSFLKFLENATQELVSRVELQNLRQSYFSTPGFFIPFLKEPPPIVHGAIERTDLIESCIKTLNLNGALILQASTGAGKTTLASFIVNSLGQNFLWASFREEEPQRIRDLLSRIYTEIQSDAIEPLIVLDDLDLSRVHEFEIDLSALLYAVRQLEGKVIITGQNKAPTTLFPKLSLSEDSQVKVPYFDEQEILKMVVAHGETNNTAGRDWAKVIYVATSGHPQLVHARIRTLKNEGWPEISNKDLLFPSDVQASKEEAGIRLIIDVPNPDIRKFLYRLSILIGSFTFKRAMTLANVSPAISLPNEAFNFLVGPWIEQEEGNRYFVSPLLKGGGKDNFSTQELNDLNENVAISYMEEDTISPREASNALFHALLSQSEAALTFISTQLLMANQKAWSFLADQLYWFLAWAGEPGQRIFQENPSVNILLRLLQFKVSAKQIKKEKASLLIDKLLEELKEIEGAKEASLLKCQVYGQILISYEVPIRSQLFIDIIMAFSDLVDEEPDLQEIMAQMPALDLPDKQFLGLSVIQQLFSTIVVRINGLENLEELFNALETLPDSKRQNLLESLQKIREDSDLLINNAWWKDVEQERLDVNKGVKIYKNIATKLINWKKEDLAIDASIASSVLLNEYAEDSEGALAILDDAEKTFGNNDNLNNQRAKIFYHSKKYLEAISIWKGLLTDNLKIGEINKTHACRLAGISAANTENWTLAEEFFRKGIHISGKQEVLHYMNVGLIADVAFVLWKQGKAKDALLGLSEALQHLEKIDEASNLEAKYLHAVVRHCVGWIHGDAFEETNEDIVEPSPGFCSRQERPPELEDRSIVELPLVWGLLGNTEILLGSNLGISEIATERLGGRVPLFIEADKRLAHFKCSWLKGDLEGIIQNFIKILESTKFYRENKINIKDHSKFFNIPSLPDGYWKVAENELAIFYLLIVASTFSFLKFKNKPLPIDKWKEDASNLGIPSENIVRFLNLLKGEERDPNNVLHEQAAYSLAQIKSGNLTVNEIWNCHFRLFDLFRKYDFATFVESEFSDMVKSEWSEFLENRSFELLSPRLNGPLIKTACNNSEIKGFNKVALILESVLGGLNLRVGEEIKKLLKSTAKTATR